MLDQLLHEFFSVVLLLLKPCFQIFVITLELGVLGVRSLSDVCDQLQVVCQLILSLGLLCGLISAFGFLLLNFLFGARNHAFELASQLSSLLVLEHLELLVVVFDVFLNCFVQLDVLYPLSFHLKRKLVEVLSILIVFEALASRNLPLKLVNLLAVLLFIFYVTFGAASNLPLLLLIFFFLTLNFLF